MSCYWSDLDPSSHASRHISMLAGRVCVLTGAGRGIGAATARLLAGQHAKLVLNDLDHDLAHEAAASIRAAGGQATAFGGSVADDAFADGLIQHTNSTFGPPDVIVNNAGFLWDGMLHKMSDTQWKAILDCHLTAPFSVVRAAAPYMRAAAKSEIDQHGAPQDRCIVNITSTSGLHGNVGQANYAAAKAGIVGLTKTLAREWGPLGIRANAVAFGMIDTRMTGAFNDDDTIEVEGQKVQQGLPEAVAKAWQSNEAIGHFVPLARKGTPEEAANGILFLASPIASYITGHTLEVTGGMGM